MALDRQTMNALGAAALSLTDGVRAAMRAATPLDDSALAALISIDANPGRSIRDLAAVLGISHSGAVRVVGRLESAGLVYREDGADARTAALSTTERARGHILPASRARRLYLESLTLDLTTAQATQVRAVIDLLLTRLTPTHDAATRACRLCQHRKCSVRTCPALIAAGSASGEQ